MGEELSTGIALCTAWASNDVKSWARIAHENGASNDDRTSDVMGQLTHIAVQLARGLASIDPRFSDAQGVLNHLAMAGLLEDGDSTP